MLVVVNWHQLSDQYNLFKKEEGEVKQRKWGHLSTYKSKAGAFDILLTCCVAEQLFLSLWFHFSFP